MTTNSKHTNQNHSHPSRAGMSTALVLGLAILAVAGVSATAYAQELDFIQVNVEIEVTDLVIERGTYADFWSFEVEVTNNGAKDVLAIVDVLRLEDDYGWFSDDGFSALNACYAVTNANLVNAGETVSILGCYPATSNTDAVPPAGISIVGLEWRDTDWGDKLFAHILPFVSGECRHNADYQTCQSVQNIDRLIRAAEREADSEPEPMMCEVPTVAVAPGSTTDAEQPQLLTAAYHELFGDLVLSFDESITLMDGWQDNITVGGVPIGERAENHMVGASSLAWISVDYTAKNNIRDAHSQAVTIEAGTFMDADGNANDRIIIQATITG